MARKVITVILAALLIPYVMTLAWTGRVKDKREEPRLTASGKLILLDRKSGESYMDVEEYLPGVVARQMPVDYGREALRAQAVIARTYICRKMDGTDQVRESELNLEYLKEEDLKKMWGSEAFVEDYRILEEAVGSTAGTVMTYEGNLIDPLFHRASTGMTRAGDESHPYLQSVSSPGDVEAEGYLSVVSFTKEDFAKRINRLGGEIPLEAGEALASLQIISREESGYVKEVQAGTKVYGGEELQYVLGLSSPAYTFEEYEGGVRAVCKGIGHGYGLSQYGAKIRAGEGRTAEEILSDFYKNIVLISE